MPVSAARFSPAVKVDLKRASVIRKATREGAGSSLWRPTAQDEYMYMGNGWQPVAAVTFTYDTAGNAIVTETEEDGIRYLTTCIYNQYNMLLTRLGQVDMGQGLENETRRTYVYDTILHDYFIERMGYEWTAGEWVEDFRCEQNAITRDDRGNIVEIVKSLPLNAVMTPAYKLMWNYDASTGRADGMAYYYYGGTLANPWVMYDNTEYRDIVWEKTDGQMTMESLLDYCEGPNLLKSAAAYYNGAVDGYLFFEYPAEGEYIKKETFNNPGQVGRETVKTITDGYGSYEIKVSDYFDDNGNYSPEATYSYSVTVTLDRYGNPVLEEYSESTDGGEPVMVDGYKAEYQYDANGNVIEMISYYYDPATLGGYAPESRIVYGNYQEFAGVERVEADTDAPAIYYNLMGRVVKNPVSGLYIKLRGNKAEKIVLP